MEVFLAVLRVLEGILGVLKARWELENSKREEIVHDERHRPRHLRK